MVLDKKETLFERDEEGKLIPQEVKLVIDKNDEEQKKYENETIEVIPIPRGKLKKLFSRAGKDSDDDIDSEVISEYCVSPSFTIEEAKDIRPPFSSIIVDTIFDVSGISTRKKNARQAFNDAEDEFAKN